MQIQSVRIFIWQFGEKKNKTNEPKESRSIVVGTSCLVLGLVFGNIFGGIRQKQNKGKQMTAQVSKGRAEKDKGSTKKTRAAAAKQQEQEEEPSWNMVLVNSSSAGRKDMFQSLNGGWI